jgi:hypothetical protein
MSEFAPICIYLVISPLVSLIPLGVPFALSKRALRPHLTKTKLLLILGGFLSSSLIGFDCMDFLWKILLRLGFYLGSRALAAAFLKCGFPGFLALGIGMGLRTLLTSMSFVGNWMLPGEASGWTSFDERVLMESMPDSSSSSINKPEEPSSSEENHPDPDRDPEKLIQKINEFHTLVLQQFIHYKTAEMENSKYTKRGNK